MKKQFLLGIGIIIFIFLAVGSTSSNKKEKERKAKAEKYEEEQAKITPEEKAKAEQENEERKRKFAEQKAEIEKEKKERVPKLKEFQEALESNKAVYYDSYEKMVANIETENESQLRPNVNSALRNFKKADKEINDLYKKFVETEQDAQTKSIKREMWISYQNTMGNKYSVVEAIQKYLDTNDDRELPVIRDLAQMARNSEMEHATKDLPKFKREIGE